MRLPYWAFLLPALLQGCSSQEYSERHIALLASDAHVSIGSVGLVIPLAALSASLLDIDFSYAENEQALEAFASDMTDQGQPKEFDVLALRVFNYGQKDGGDRSRICPLLTRRWAESACAHTSPVHEALPSDLHLIDAAKLGSIEGIYDGAGGVLDRVVGAKLQVGAASTLCGPDDEGDQHCIAATLIKDDLGALWFSSGDQGENDRYAEAITAFVNYGLGETEDFPELMTALCPLRRPNAPESDDCAGL